MTRVHLLTGTRDSLGGEPVGVANAWERPGLDGVSVLLVFDDREVAVAVGDTVEAGAGRWRAVAVEAHAPTGGAVLVLEPLAPAEPTGLEAPRASERDASEVVTVRPISVGDLARRLRDLTPRAFEALGHAAVGLDWERTSHDSYTPEWNGGRVGPSTQTVHRARPAEGVEARVATDVTRWSERSVANQRASASWRAGDRRASCGGGAQGEDAVRELWTRGPAPLLAELRDALGEVPMADGFLVRVEDAVRADRPTRRTVRCPSAMAVEALLEAAAGQRWRTALDVRRAAAPEGPPVTAAGWRAGARP